MREDRGKVRARREERGAQQSGWGMGGEEGGERVITAACVPPGLKLIGHHQWLVPQCNWCHPIFWGYNPV